MLSTAPLTWPTPAELDAIDDCMGGEGGALDQIDRLHSLLRRFVSLGVCPSIEVAEAIERGADPLTLETVGAVASCLAKLRHDLDFALDEVRTMEQMRDAMALEVVIPTSAAGDDA